MKIKIAFFSFADIDNFGDILFSHVFKMEVEKRIADVEIDYYCPSEFEVEGIKYKSYEKSEIENGNYDCLIVFGGEVIHLYDERTWKPIYNKNNQRLKSELPSDVIFDWVDLHGPFKAWVSVGVRPVDNEKDLSKIQKAVNSLDYVSVRGGLSKKILENLELQSNNTKINITPDLGWFFPNFLEYKRAKGKHFKRYIENEKYFVFQINSISDLEAKGIADYLYAFQKTNKIKTVLLPVIRPWEDYKYLKLIYENYPNDFLLLPNNLNILEIADILTHSSLVLSSSLHANITALASGIPAGIINKWQGTKLQDIYGHQFRLSALRHEIEDIPHLLNEMLNEDSGILIQYANFMKSILNQVFDKLVCGIENRHFK